MLISPKTIRFALTALLAVILFVGCEPDPKENAVPRSGENSSTGGLNSGARVVGFRFALPGDDEPGVPVPSGFSLIQSDGNINFEQLDELKRKQATLSNTQVGKLVSAVHNAENKTSPAACYDPHHIFLFYDDAEQVTKVIEICFSCTKIRTQPELTEDQWYRHDFRALARLCEEIGIGLGAQTAEQFIEALDVRERL